MSVLYQKCFPLWLKEYCKKLDKAHKKRQKVTNDECFDAILSLISISVQEEDENVKLVKKGELEKEIS